MSNQSELVKRIIAINHFIVSFFFVLFCFVLLRFRSFFFLDDGSSRSATIILVISNIASPTTSTEEFRVSRSCCCCFCGIRSSVIIDRLLFVTRWDEELFDVVPNDADNPEDGEDARNSDHFLFVCLFCFVCLVLFVR